MFKESEIRRLKESPYVLDVSAHKVHFSAEFKEIFWNEVQAGKTPREVVIEYGMDPDILGYSRMNGLKSMIRNDIRTGKGFRDIRTSGVWVKEYMDPETKIKQLEQQLAYKNQEIEFLKKIVFLAGEDTES